MIHDLAGRVRVPVATAEGSARRHERAVVDLPDGGTVSIQATPVVYQLRPGQRVRVVVVTGHDQVVGQSVLDVVA